MSERLEKGTFVISAICPGVPASEMPELPPAGQYMHGIECPGGIVGKITDIADQFITVQVASVNGQPVQLSMQRAAVQTLLPKGTVKSL